MKPFEDDEDPRPGEPEEFDPDSVGPEIPDVEPEVDVPSVDALGAAADVDEDIFRAFWGAVVFLNVAVAALAVAAMLVFFRGDWSTAGPAALIGLVSAAFVGRFYLTYLSARDDADDADEEPVTGEGGPGDGDVRDAVSGDRRADARAPADGPRRDGGTGDDP